MWLYIAYNLQWLSKVSDWSLFHLYSEMSSNENKDLLYAKHDFTHMKVMHL